MMSHTLFSEWFDYETITSIDHHSLPAIAFHRCILKRRLVHLPVGTRFESLIINYCGVFEATILDEGQVYLYMGKVTLMIAGYRFEELVGYSGVVYAINRPQVTEGKIVFQKCFSREDSKLYQRDTQMSHIVYDFAQSTFSSSSPPQTHPMMVNFVLGLSSTPTAYLHRDARLSITEHRAELERRRRFGWTGTNPKYLENEAVCPYDIDVDGFARTLIIS